MLGTNRNNRRTEHRHRVPDTHQLLNETDAMTLALWITAILLTLVYIMAGGIKVVRSKAQLQLMMPWVEDFSEPQVTLIGALGLLGALGVILPLATGIAPVFTPIAAIGLVLLQIGAITVHVRRGERSSLGVNFFLLVLAAAVAVLGFLA